MTLDNILIYLQVQCLPDCETKVQDPYDAQEETTILDWKRRYNVITGVAKGLLYLHQEAPSRIIHRDIKASNILLDDKWVPKIADFGMAPSVQAYQLCKKHRSLEMMDNTLVSSADLHQVSMCIHIGLLCVQSDPKLRPDMGRVVLMLSKWPPVLEELMRPGYPGSMYRMSDKLVPSSSATLSSSQSSATLSSSQSSATLSSSQSSFGSSTNSSATSSSHPRN